MTTDALSFLNAWRSPAPTVEVQTSGSTGVPHTMQVEKSRMRASALATCQFLDIPRGATALLCLPTRFIAGKMMIVRAEVWPLKLITVEPSSHPFHGLTAPPHFVALTPAQAYQTFQQPAEAELLRHTPCVLIGGGAVSPQLEEQLGGCQGGVWSSYGMTETLSHIALRRIGETGYRPLPGVKVGVARGSTDAPACLWIDAPHVCPTRLQTNDVAELLPDGRFRIIGRKDNVVCSGGLKLQLEELEQDIATQSGLQIGQDFLLTWVADPKWGQALTLLITRQAPLPASLPAGPSRPKHIVRIPALPLTPTGKPARLQAHQLATQALNLPL